MVQSQEVRSLTIGKLAAKGGVGVETVRFYQRKGLLEQPLRDAGGPPLWYRGRPATAFHKAGAGGGLHARADPRIAAIGRKR
jgi:hypothetical protein